jgi:hypothetical protein
MKKYMCAGLLALLMVPINAMETENKEKRLEKWSKFTWWHPTFPFFHFYPFIDSETLYIYAVFESLKLTLLDQNWYFLRLL